MLDFKAISEMDIHELTDYASQLDDKTIYINRNILNFINGFILCKSLCKHNLKEDQLSKIFLAYLEGNKIKELENLYKKS
jgi:hypothetical protein